MRSRAATAGRSLADLGGQLRHVLELALGRPRGVAAPPGGFGLQPDREGLGKVLGRVRLRVPLAQVLHVVAAGGPGAILRGVAARGVAKQGAPACAAAQAVRRVEGMAGLVAQDPHLPVGVAPLHRPGHLALQAREPAGAPDRKARRSPARRPGRTIPRPARRGAGRRCRVPPAHDTAARCAAARGCRAGAGASHTSAGRAAARPPSRVQAGVRRFMWRPRSRRARTSAALQQSIAEFHDQFRLRQRLAPGARNSRQAVVRAGELPVHGTDHVAVTAQVDRAQGTVAKICARWPGTSAPAPAPPARRHRRPAAGSSRRCHA